MAGECEVSTKVFIKNHMGHSPVRGYIAKPADELGDGSGVFEQASQADKTSIILYELHGTGTWSRSCVRLPKDPDDMLALCTMLLRITHGPLAALALTTTVVEDVK
jgi:hypothetical protein